MVGVCKYILVVSDSDKCSPWHSYFQCIGSNPLSASSRFARFFYRDKILARHWHTFAHPLGRIFTYKAGFSPHIAPNGAVAVGHIGMGQVINHDLQRVIYRYEAINCYLCTK